jgi:hypothetical protein
LGGGEERDVVGCCMGAVVAGGAGGVLAAHVSVGGLEVGLEFFPVLGRRRGVELPPFAACEIVATCLGYNVVCPAKNGWLGGFVIPLCRECNAIFDLYEECFDGGGGGSIAPSFE